MAQHCYSAMAAYLPLTAANGEPTQPAAQVARHLAEAAAAVDAFYSRHRYILDNAIGAVSAAAAAAAAATTAQPAPLTSAWLALTLRGATTRLSTRPTC